MRSMILGILLLTADVAHAETGDKGYFTLGLGAPSCGQFIAVIGNAPPGKYDVAYGMYVSWLGGFVSGYNATQYGLWMRNWCDKNPTKMVADGAVALINEMNAER